MTTDRLRLLFTITLSETGGATNNVRDLIRSFYQDHDVSLVVGEDGPLADTVRALGVTVHVLPALQRRINPVQDLKAIAEFREVLRKERPDVVHAHSTKAGLVARVAARMEGIPSVYTAHGWVFAPGPPPLLRTVVWAMELIACRLGTTVACVSRFDQRYARSRIGLSAKRMEWIPYGIDDRPLPPTRPENDRPIIFMPARFQQQKNQPLLLEAAAKVADRDFEIWLAGQGPDMDASRELTERLGLSSRVRFMGDRDDVPELLEQVDIFVLFSRYEGLPISIMEAMRAGLPVLANSVCGVPEEVTHGTTGLLSESENIDESAAILAELLDDPEKRRAMGEAGREKFLAEYTRDVMARSFLSLYRRLAQPRSHESRPAHGSQPNVETDTTASRTSTRSSKRNRRHLLNRA